MYCVLSVANEICSFATADYYLRKETVTLKSTQNESSYCFRYTQTILSIIEKKVIFFNLQQNTNFNDRDSKNKNGASVCIVLLKASDEKNITSCWRSWPNDKMFGDKMRLKIIHK